MKREYYTNNLNHLVAEDEGYRNPRDFKFWVPTRDLSEQERRDFSIGIASEATLLALRPILPERIPAQLALQFLDTDLEIATKVAREQRSVACCEWRCRVEVGACCPHDFPCAMVALGLVMKRPRALTIREVLEEHGFDSLEEALQEWDVSCPSMCAEGCEVELDGKCPHGHPSIVLKMGWI